MNKHEDVAGMEITGTIPGNDNPEKTQETAKKGILKSVKDAVVAAYDKVKTNPVGRVVINLGKVGAGALIVKKAYDTGFKKGQENPVIVTITEGVQEETNAEEAKPEEVQEEPEEKTEENC